MVLLLKKTIYIVIKSCQSKQISLKKTTYGNTA